MPTMEDGPTPSYQVVSSEKIDSTPEYPCDRTDVSDEADLSVLAAAIYSIAPGEQLARSYHYHEQREELFSVRSGTLYVETPEREYTVTAGELFIAQPGSPHRAYNPDTADQSVEVVGVGAPRYDPARAYDPSE